MKLTVKVSDNSTYRGFYYFRYKKSAWRHYPRRRCAATVVTKPVSANNSMEAMVKLICKMRKPLVLQTCDLVFIPVNKNTGKPKKEPAKIVGFVGYGENR